MTKAEKKQASDWDQGREECQEWFLKCTEPDAKRKKAQVPQTILDKVCWAINEAMPNDGRAMAYIPQTAQSQEGYVQNSRGRKRAVAKSAADKVHYSENSKSSANQCDRSLERKRSLLP